MFLVGLLTATEKQVLKRLIQWHLKNNWHILESLKKLGKSLSKVSLLVAEGEECPPRPTLASTSTTGHLINATKKIAHKLLGTNGHSVVPKRV